MSAARTQDSALAGRVAARIADVDRAQWDACFPGEAESHAYYVACEAAGPVGHTMAAALVEDAQGIAAAAPVFSMAYRLDTSLQGWLKPAAEWLTRHTPRLVTLPVIGFGSPYAERCHIGFRQGLDVDERGETAGTLVAMLLRHARDKGVGLVAIKDLASPDEQALLKALNAQGFARAGGLPVAVLDLPDGGESAYLASLSSATRKDIRRKLAGAAALRIEERTDIADVADEIEALYAETRAASGVDYGDFEALPPGYFTFVSQALRGRALFTLYFVGSTLAAFNLLLIEKDRVIDKFLGMRYPLAREHNVYALSWMTNVRLCQRLGIRKLQTGQTAYAEKLRFGSRLESSAIWFRHRRAVANTVLRAASPYLAFDRHDPDLRAMRRRAP